MADPATACLIDADTFVRGRIEGDGPIEVVGQVHGSIASGDRLWVRPGGQVSAEVRAGEVRLDGQLDGDVVVAGHLEARPGAQLTGSLRATTLALAAEAKVQATVEMDLDLPSGMA